MSVDIDKLRALLARKEGRHWYPRNRFISLVPDNSGMGATLPTNHIANFVDKETCELASEAVNALPQLLAIAEAAMALRGWSMAGKIHTDMCTLEPTIWLLGFDPAFAELMVVAVDQVNGTITLERSSTVEQRALIPSVGGSNPSARTNRKRKRK